MGTTATGEPRDGSGVRLLNRMPAPPDGTLVMGGLTLKELVASGCGLLSFAAVYLSGILGSLGALLFLVSWLPYAALYPRDTYHLLTRRPVVFIWALPALALASVLWSRDPTASLRHGLQFLATIGIAVLIARAVPPARLLAMLAIALAVVAAACLASGRRHVDPITGAAAFVGIFASKNQFGFLIALLMLCASAIAFSRERPAWQRATSLLALPLTIPLLMQARSAGSLVTATLAVAAIIMTYLFCRLRPAERGLLVFALLISAVPLLVFVQYGDELYAEFVRTVLQRDATLTGRTVLWDFARGIIADHPVLGLGYQAFWRIGNPDAEYLWAKFYITNQAGFHFHNVWFDMGVQLGLAGSALITLLFGTALVTCLGWNWRERSMTSAFYVATVALLIFRGYFEVDLPVQFQPGTMFLFIALSIGLDRRHKRRRANR